MSFIFSVLAWFAAAPHQFWWFWLPLGFLTGYHLDVMSKDPETTRLGRWVSTLSFHNQNIYGFFVWLGLFVVPIVRWIAVFFFNMNATGSLGHLLGTALFTLIFDPIGYRNHLHKMANWLARRCQPWWRRMGKKISNHLRSWRHKHEEKQWVKGAEIKANFDRLRDDILIMIEDSVLLAGLGHRVKSLVENDVPRLLKQREYLITNIPKVREVIKTVGDGRGLVTEELQVSRNVLVELEQRLEDTKGLLERLRLRFEHYKPLIVRAHAGLASEGELAEDKLAELDMLATAINESIIDVVGDGGPNLQLVPPPTEGSPEERTTRRVKN